MSREQEIAQLKKDWAENPRWKGIRRPYTAEDVVRLRGTVRIEYTLARLGAEKLWKYLNTEPYVSALGALTGNQAMQQARAGLKAIYLSGWQVAADANDSLEMYPDQSLYAVTSVPNVVRRINNTFIRCDQLHHAEGKDEENRADRDVDAVEEKHFHPGLLSPFWLARHAAGAANGCRRVQSGLRSRQGRRTAWRRAGRG